VSRFIWNKEVEAAGRALRLPQYITVIFAPAMDDGNYSGALR